TDDGLELRRNLDAERVERGRRRAGDRAAELGEAPRPERRPAGEHLEEEDADGVDVDAGVARTGAEELLGARVGRGAHRAAGGRELAVTARIARRVDERREPEVEELHELGPARPRGEQDVVRLEIAVDDAL